MTTFYVIEKKNSGARECVKLDKDGFSLVPWREATKFYNWASAQLVLDYVDKPLPNGWSGLTVTEHGMIEK